MKNLRKHGCLVNLKHILLSSADMDDSTLPVLPPNPVFDDLSTVDASLERRLPITEGALRRVASIPRHDANSITNPPTQVPQDQTPAPTTDEIVRLILIGELRDAEDALDA